MADEWQTGMATFLEEFEAIWRNRLRTFPRKWTIRMTMATAMEQKEVSEVSAAKMAVVAAEGDDMRLMAAVVIAE